MGKKLLSIFLVAIMLLSLAACDSDKKETTTVATTTKAGETTTAATEPDLPYDYGVDTTFHADAPVTYSMYFSDASWYALADTWKTEGVFAKITELTNVTLDITSISSGDYNDGISLEISSGQSKYIIPKVYDESDYVAGGAVVAVSDYVQYMPYYQDFVTKYNMAPDLATITKADGKYYRLPGMLEAPMQDYTLLVRNDIFKAAGVDVAALESDWTWNDLCDELVKVKAYMVANDMCKESDYIWSDLWCGSESGQGNGGNLLKLMGASYGVPSGWAVGNGMQYDADTDSWYFASITDDYKEFVTVAARFVNEGILDPETFTQDDTTATSKFYNGETVIMSVNRGQYANFVKGISEIQGEGNFELYIAVSPIGSNTYIAERNRLENGVMISQNALDDLGEEGFIQMMRFVDWLWYSPEAYTLIKWGVEGETFEYVTDATTGLQVKQLLPGFKCGGLGIAGAEEDVDIRLQWGYAGGVFWYGGTLAEMRDNFTPVINEFNARLDKYRTVKSIDPAVAADEDQNETLSLIKTPLIDNVNTWTLLFVTGQKDITADWDEYVASCENLDYETMVDMTNEIYHG
jgi:putative aldouronate transport system substrate-binding protein